MTAVRLGGSPEGRGEKSRANVLSYFPQHAQVVNFLRVQLLSQRNYPGGM